MLINTERLYNVDPVANYLFAGLQEDFDYYSDCAFADCYYDVLGFFHQPIPANTLVLEKYLC